MAAYIWSPRKKGESTQSSNEYAYYSSDGDGGTASDFVSRSDYYTTSDDESGVSESEYEYQQQQQQQRRRRPRRDDLKLGESSDEDHHSDDDNNGQQQGRRQHGPPPTQNVFQHTSSHSPVKGKNNVQQHHHHLGLGEGGGPPPSFPGLHQDDDDDDDDSDADGEHSDRDHHQQQQQQQHHQQYPPHPPNNNADDDYYYYQQQQKIMALKHLTRARPLDPVFHAPGGEASFPKMALSSSSSNNNNNNDDPSSSLPEQQQQHSKNNPIHIFVPKPEAVAAPDPEEEEEKPKVVVPTTSGGGGGGEYSSSTNDNNSLTYKTYYTVGLNDEGGTTGATTCTVGWNDEPEPEPIDDNSFLPESNNTDLSSDAPEELQVVPALLEDDDEEEEEKTGQEVADDDGGVELEANNVISDDPVVLDSNEDSEGSDTKDPDSWDWGDDSSSKQESENNQEEEEKETKVDEPVSDKEEEIISEETIHSDDDPVVKTTPVHQKPSRFVFLSDRKNVPTDLKKLQERTIRHRRDEMKRMHDLDCQLALMTSKYAEEKMDLDLAIRDAFDRTVSHPLEAAAERLVMERESSAYRAPALAELEQRLSKLDCRMARHSHVTLSDAKREELDSLYDDLSREIIPEIRMENSKSDKIEGGVIGRFEEVVGSLARRFHEESAARRSAIDLVREKVQKAVDQEELSFDGFLAQISELRAQISRERAERKAADKKIIEEIAKTTIFMKRALIQAMDMD